MWLEHIGLAWVVTEASSMMKWGPMRVTVTSNVNFDSWLMNIKIVGPPSYWTSLLERQRVSLCRTEIIAYSFAC